MIHCEFELNNKRISLFKYANWQAEAFSGNGVHTNRVLSICMPSIGPIPPGKYYILDRRSGGFLGPLGRSEGCITIEKPADFLQIRAMLKGTSTVNIPNTELKAYGVVVVK